MASLKLVPAWCRWVLALFLVGGVQQMRVGWAEGEAAQARSALADYRLEVSERDRRADAQARTEEQRRQKAADEVEQNAKGKLEAAQADAAAAESAADGLRREVDRLRAGRAATCGAIAAQQRQAGEPAVVVLGELLESADRMAGDLAAALERSRIAGQARQCPRPWSVNARMMGRPDLHSAWAHSLGGARMVGKRLNLSVPFSSSYWL